MKNCKQIELMFGEAISEELTGEQLKRFNEHLNSCESCSSQFTEFKATLNIMEKRKRPEMKEEFWDNYWNNLSEKAFLDKPTIQERIRTSMSILLVDHRKFAIPTAALVLILFGLFLGKMLFSPESSSILQNNNQIISNSSNNSIDKNSRYYSMVNNHMDDLKPIFAEYSNYQASDESGSEFLSIKKDLLKKLMLQNYLLKRVADKNNDPQLKSLIEDLQLILLEIINDSSTGNEKIKSVKYMLNGSDVLFKMNMLKKKNRFYKKAKVGETI